MWRYGLIFVLVSPACLAGPIKYSFAMKAVTGPLAGEQSVGHFRISPAESRLLHGLVFGQGRFDDFQFSWGGEQFDEIGIRWGWTYFTRGLLDFAAGGGVFGNSCGNGYCSFGQTNTWFVYGNGEGHYSYQGAAGTTRVTFSVPEPPTYVLSLGTLLLLLGGSFVVRRRSGRPAD